MKAIILGLTLLSCISPALAVDRAELDDRLRLWTAKFEAMQQKPDRHIPADVLSRAKGIVLLDRTKAGFGFAYQGGGGVALVKNDRGEWSPPAFLNAREASFGFQIGGEQDFLVMLFMDRNAIHELTGAVSELGGEARGTAGNDTAGVGSKATAPQRYDVQVYADRNGLYGGAFVKNGAILPDSKANLSYYGEPLTMRNILFDNEPKLTPAASGLAEKLSEYSGK